MVKLEKDIKLQKAFEETGEILDNCQNERFDPRAGEMVDESSKQEICPLSIGIQ